jgi:hypothetical protein
MDGVSCAQPRPVCGRAVCGMCWLCWLRSVAYAPTLVLPRLYACCPPPARLCAVVGPALCACPPLPMRVHPCVVPPPAPCSRTADILELESSPVFTISFPEPSNRQRMLVTARPDEYSWWHRGVFEFSLNIPDDYPHGAPKVHCNTKVP